MAKKDTKLAELAKTVSEMAEDLRGTAMEKEFFDELGKGLALLSDSRQQTKVRHKLGDIVAIVFLAMLCDVDEWVEMEYFAIDQREILGQYLELPHGIPSHDTLERVIAIINPDELQGLLVNTLKNVIMRSTKEMGMPLYTNEALNIEIDDIVAADGKETRNTGKKNTSNEEDGRNLNELNVQSTEYGITLSSTRIGEKTNEIPELQSVLKTLDLRKCIVTADALNTQKETVNCIVMEAHADYCLALKSNQRNAYADVCAYFADETLRTDLEGQVLAYRKEVETLSDRTVVREYYITDDIQWFTDRNLWKKLTSIGYEKKTIKHLDGRECTEERYFLCSIKADVELFSIVVRRHWHVENLLHWVLDVTFREDSLRTREKKALHNLGLIRRTVLSLLKILKEHYGKISYRHMRRKIGRTFEAQIPVIFSVVKELYDRGMQEQ